MPRRSGGCLSGCAIFCVPIEGNSVVRVYGRYKTWADTYWQQLQHLSAAANALNQQHMLALSNQNQQMAALAQYQMHVNAAAQLVKSAGASLPGLQVRRES